LLCRKKSDSSPVQIQGLIDRLINDVLADDTAMVPLLAGRGER
jgi:hypothetical protein